MCDGRSWCGAKADFIAKAEPDAKWAGFSFKTGPMLQSVPGVYVYGRTDGERVYAVSVGEADDMAQALAQHAETAAPAMAGADAFYWMIQPNARLRISIVQTIVERYHPTANDDLPVKPATAPESGGGFIRGSAFHH